MNPSAALDADLRADMREHVRAILKSMRATVVFVTHEQDEALYMGDRLAVLQNGHLEQIGSPEEIFHDSRTRFVAEFMGDSDFLPGSDCAGRDSDRNRIASTNLLICQFLLPWKLPCGEMMWVFPRMATRTV